MSQDRSTSPPTSGAQMEPVQATNASPSPPSSSVDMLALGFGVLPVDSSEDPNKQSVVSADFWFTIACTTSCSEDFNYSFDRCHLFERAHFALH